MCEVRWDHCFVCVVRWDHCCVCVCEVRWDHWCVCVVRWDHCCVCVCEVRWDHWCVCVVRWDHCSVCVCCQMGPLLCVCVCCQMGPLLCVCVCVVRWDHCSVFAGSCWCLPVTSLSSLTGPSMTALTRWWSLIPQVWRRGNAWCGSTLRNTSFSQPLRAKGQCVCVAVCVCVYVPACGEEESGCSISTPQSATLRNSLVCVPISFSVASLHGRQILTIS